jgi:chromosome segregation ATPase
MLIKEVYLERVLAEVEEFAAKVALLKAKLAQEKPGVKLRYYWELEYLRDRFAEFRRRVEKLEDAEDEKLEELQESTETAWKDMKQAIETLLNEVC